MLGADSRGSLPRFHCRDWVESGYRHVRVVDADELAAYVDAGADGASEDLTIRAPAQPLRRVLRTSPLPRTGAWIENPQRHCPAHWESIRITAHKALADTTNQAPAVGWHGSFWVPYPSALVPRDRWHLR